MPFATQDLFAMGFSRSMGCIAGPDAAAGAGNWRAYVIGHENGEMRVRDADEGANYFKTAPAPNPPGFSPFGDRVTLQSHMGTVVFGETPAQNPLTTPTVQEGIIFEWVQLPSFPGPIFALVYVTPANGADVLLLVDPTELSLARKNPFFP